MGITCLGTWTLLIFLCHQSASMTWNFLVQSFMKGINMRNNMEVKIMSGISGVKIKKTCLREIASTPSLHHDEVHVCSVHVFSGCKTAQTVIRKC